MPEINRYTQMPAPLKVNPISFEEFSRVPMAQAIEKGEGLAAVSRIGTNYDVDEADLGKVTEMISGLDQIKAGIVDRISTSNIDSQTVTDVLNLKKQRDDLYKTKINAAETNKKIINNWRENVDRMSGDTSPEWTEHIKNKEYQNWVQSGGTFGKEGTARTFIPKLGVKFIDEDKDIQQVIDFASQMTQTNRKSWPGSTGTTWQGDTEFFTKTTGGWKESWSNEQKLGYAKEMLKREYSDPTTARGKYVQYGERDLSTINSKIDEYYKMRIMEDKRGDPSETSIGGGTGRTKTSPLTNNVESYEYNLPRTLIYQGNKKLTAATTGVVKKSIDAYKYMVATNPDKTDVGTPGLISFGKAIKTFLSHYFQPRSTDEYKAKVDAIKELNNTAVKLRDELRTITPEQYAKAMTGTDLKAVDVVFDAIVDYQDAATHSNASSTFDTKDYAWNDFGVDTKNDQNGADIGAGAYNFTDVNSGEFVGGDKDKELSLKSLNGKLKIIGNITLGSRDLIGSNGKIKSELSSGREAVDTETGEKYYVPLSPGLRKTPNFKRIEGINNTILPLAPGESTLMVRYNPDTNNFEEVVVKHNDANIGHYVFVISDDPADDIPIDNYGSQLRTKKFYEDYDAPLERVKKKQQIDAYLKSRKK